MNSATILSKVYLAIEDNQVPPEELVILLEISSEELLRKFPRKILDNAEKFGVYDYDDQNEDPE